jgi:regulator of replication initiation timing
MRFSLSQHPTWGRVPPATARPAGFADDSYTYASLNASLKVLVEIRQRLREDAKLRFNMSDVKIYIPGVSRERSRELVLRNIDQDPSLESLRELYDQDLRVCHRQCNGIKMRGRDDDDAFYLFFQKQKRPIGTPEFVNAFVGSKTLDIEHDLQKLRIITDPEIHYA